MMIKGLVKGRLLTSGSEWDSRCLAGRSQGEEYVGFLASILGLNCSI